MSYLGATVTHSRYCLSTFSKLTKRLLDEKSPLYGCRQLFASSASPAQSVKRAEDTAAASAETTSAAPVKRKWRGMFAPQYDGDPGVPGQNLRMHKVVDNHVFIPFYHYPHITFVRALTKLKILQTGLTFVMVPILVIMCINNSISSFAVMSAVGVNAFAVAALLAFSRLFSRWIGRMYLDVTKKYVLMSHLDFWGNRKDEVLRIEDLVPLDNAGENVSDVYVKFQRLDYPKDFFYGNLSAGGVLEPEVFKEVFGILPVVKRALTSKINDKTV